VVYVDHATTEELQHKYRNDPDVLLDKIVRVDAVWGEKTLREAVGRSVDYIVASHVIEHVPDLITWLEELRATLSEQGQVRLIVPDRRFTFDYLRNETRLSDVLYARLIRAKRPHAQIVLDYCLNTRKVDCAEAWNKVLDSSSLESHFTLEDSMSVAASAARGDYHDVHCWVFTPHSFCRLFTELAESGVMPFECTMFHDTEPNTIEFFVGMQPTSDQARAVASWRAAAERLSNVDALSTHSVQTWLTEHGDSIPQQSTKRELKLKIEENLRRIESLEAGMRASQADAQALRNSRSWKYTAPLRRVMSLLTDRH
jgi:predicted SAM-dependent methyltransferase